MTGTHMIVLPGEDAAHAAHEAEPVAAWLRGLGIAASVFRYPLNVRHPVPRDALLGEIRDRRAAGAGRVGLIGFSAGGGLAGLALSHPVQGQLRRSSSRCSATRSRRWRPRPTGLPG